MFKQPPILTEGQITLERAKYNCNPDYYLLCDYATYFFDLLKPIDLMKSWENYKEQTSIFLCDESALHTTQFKAWQETLITMMFHRISRLLSDLTVMTQNDFKKYFEGILTLGIAPYRRTKTRKKTDLDFNDTDQSCAMQNTLDCDEFIRALTTIKDKVKTRYFEDGIFCNLEDTLIIMTVSNTEKSEFHAIDINTMEPLELYVSPPMWSYFREIRYNSLCALMETPMKETKFWYDMYKNVAQYEAVPFKSLLCQNSDETKDYMKTFEEISRTTENCENNELKGKKDLLLFLLKLKTSTSKNELQSLVENMITDSSSYPDERLKGDGTTSSITKHGKNEEFLSILPGNSLIEKTRRDYQTDMLKCIPSDTEESANSSILSAMTNQMYRFQENNDKYKKCIRATADMLARGNREKEVLQETCRQYEEILNRVQQPEQPKQDCWSFAELHNDPVVNPMTVKENILNDEKVIASRLNPVGPDYKSKYEHLNRLFQCVLRDRFGFIPVYTPTNERVDEVPSLTTQKTFIKPFLTMCGINTDWTVTLEDTSNRFLPLSQTQPKALFKAVFHSSPIGGICFILKKSIEEKDERLRATATNVLHRGEKMYTSTAIKLDRESTEKETGEQEGKIK